MDETSFANAIAVVDYLKMRGWRIKKSAVYLHIKQGKLRPEIDGAFRVKVVDKYARTFLKLLGDGQAVSAGLDKLQERRLKADTEKLEAQSQYWGTKAKIGAGLYVEKASFEVELALRASIFQQGIVNFIREKTPDLIRRAEGDLKLVPEVTEYLLGQVEDWLDIYSKPQEFTVVIDDDVVKNIEEEESGEKEE